MWAHIELVCGGGGLCDRGLAQQVFGDRQQVSAIGRQKSVIADLDEIFRQDVLQESANKFSCRYSGGLPLLGIAVFETEADLPVFEIFDAVIGGSDSVDIRRQVF